MGGPTDGCMEPPYLAAEQAKAHCQSLGFLLAENPEKERVVLLLEFEKRMDTVWTPRRRDRVVSTGEGGGPPNVRPKPGQRPVEREKPWIHGEG